MMIDWNNLVLGEEDSQTAPVYNGTVREMIADIDRLKGELEEAKADLHRAVSANSLYNQQASNLEHQLEEANNTTIAHANTISRVEAANVHLQDQLASANKHKSDWHNMYQETYDELSSVQQAILVETARIKTAWREIATLEQQLAEARAEIERLKVIKWVQTESYEAVAAVEQARQEAAKWVADLLFSPEWEKECHCCEDYYCSICRIKDEFKLEG